MQFHFSTVVWGPWHTGVFLDVNLPSLLAPGNIPAFCARHQVEYRIFTSRADAERIKSSPAFQAASQYVDFQILIAPVESAADPIAMHHALWRRSIEEAQVAGVMVLFVPPDVIWADGSFESVARHVDNGKRAVFMTYMRVVSETCVPDVMRCYLSDDGASLQASSRELVAMMHKHIHPLTLTYLNDSQNFPIHPEFILWRVPAQGYLMRVLVREMFCYDPALFDLNAQALPAMAIDPDIAHFITDSDELFSLSLAPGLKDLVWYLEPQVMDSLKVGSWWLRYDSPANDYVSTLTFRVHGGDVDLAAWRSAELQSQATVARIKGTREILRFIGALPARPYSTLSKFLGMLLCSSHIARALTAKGPFVCLIPQDAALFEYLENNGSALMQVPGRRSLINLLKDYIIQGEWHFSEGQTAILTTIGGRKRGLTWRGEIAYVDGVAIKSEQSTAGPYVYYVLDGMLPPAIASS